MYIYKTFILNKLFNLFTHFCYYLILDIGYETYETISNLPHLDSLDAFSINTRHRRQLAKVDLTSTQAKDKEMPQQRTNSRMLGDIDAIANATATAAAVPVPTHIIASDRALLGVNGTGQRKDYLGATKVPVVSEPINPNDSSNTNSSSSLSPSLLSSSTSPSSLTTPSPPPSTTRSIIDDWVASVDASDDETSKIIEKNNLTLKEDYHTYYRSAMIVDNDYVKKYWGNFENFKTDDLLSQSYRRAIVSTY